jgi:hypothetical protein
MDFMIKGIGDATERGERQQFVSGKSQGHLAFSLMKDHNDRNVLAAPKPVPAS